MCCATFLCLAFDRSLQTAFIIDNVLQLFHTGLEVGWCAIPAIPWPTQNRAVTSFLRNTIMECTLDYLKICALALSQERDFQPTVCERL